MITSGATLASLFSGKRNAGPDIHRHTCRSCHRSVIVKGVVAGNAIRAFGKAHIAAPRLPKAQNLRRETHPQGDRIPDRPTLVNQRLNEAKGRVCGGISPGAQFRQGEALWLTIEHLQWRSRLFLPFGSFAPARFFLSRKSPGFRRDPRRASEWTRARAR